MKTLFFSIPSGSHKRAYFQPVYNLIKNNLDVRIVAITPATRHPELLSEFTANDRLVLEEFSPELYEKYKPSLVTASTTGLDTKDVPILQEAKNKGVKTLVYIESWDNIWKMVKRQDEMVKVDCMLVWNKMMQRQLIDNLNYNPKSIKIVGSPRLDMLCQEDFPSKDELYDKLGLDPSRPLIHIATVELYDNSYVMKTISEARKQGKIPSNTQIYASIHPGGDISKHELYAKKYNVDLLRYSFGRKNNSPLKEFKYNPTQNDMKLLYSVFKHSDLLVNFSSTVAIESMIADTPVINVMFGKPFDWCGWRRSAVYRDFQEHYKDIVDSGGTWVVKNKGQLIKAINAYLSNPSLHKAKRRKASLKMVTYLDGKCSERVYNELINNLNV